MIKKIVNVLSKKPVILNFLRNIVEFNYITIEKIIKKEFSLDELTSDNGQNKVLDVPCGMGRFCELFNNPSYIGIDISHEYINYAKRTYKQTFYYRDACKSGFGESYFDKILIVSFFHHLDIPTIVAVLEEMKRVLKKDGKILLIEDIPITSKWNFIGKFLQKHDIGNYIRHAEEYKKLIERYFAIDKYYHIRNGLSEYSVFILTSKKR